MENGKEIYHRYLQKPPPAIEILKMGPSYIERFPGEIRNHIYECCIDMALQPANVKCRQTRHRGRQSYWRRIKPVPGSKEESKELQFDMKVVSRWNRRSVIRTRGLGSLPLLFASRKIYAEISSLIYARARDLCVGGYILEHPGEDPSGRWKESYSLLQKQPGLLKFTRSILIQLPSIREDLDVGLRRSLGLIPRLPKSGSSNDITRVWASLAPELSEFLLRFEALSTIRIIIQVENQAPPKFETLFQL